MKHLSMEERGLMLQLFIFLVCTFGFVLLHVQLRAQELKLGLRLTANMTYASADFQTVNVVETLANVADYTNEIIAENAEWGELSFEDFINGNLPQISFTDYNLIAYQTIDRTGIKPQIGLELSAYSRYFDVSARLTNGKYSNFSLAAELQAGLGLGAILLQAFQLEPKNSVGFVLSSCKAGVIVGYDSSFNPIWSLDLKSSNSHFNIFFGLDIPIMDRWHFHFIAATDLVRRPNENKQSFIRAGLRYTFNEIFSSRAKKSPGKRSKKNRYFR